MERVLEVLLYFFVVFAGWKLGKNISVLTNCIIRWKQRKRTEAYRTFRKEKPFDKIIDSILITVGIVIAVTYMPMTEAVFTSLMTGMALLLVRIDQRIRIIPNELVLLLLLVGCMKQIALKGIIGLGEGLIAALITMSIMLLAAFLNKLFSGAMGVGAGDIKLMIALSMMIGIHQLPNLFIGISTTLLLYLVYLKITVGFFLKQSFPMAVQIMGGFILAMHHTLLIDMIKIVIK